MKVLSIIATILLIIGGLNWGLVGFFQYNAVDNFLGQWPMLVRVIYALVGLSALYKIFAWRACCKASS